MEIVYFESKLLSLQESRCWHGYTPRENEDIRWDGQINAPEAGCADAGQRD